MYENKKYKITKIKNHPGPQFEVAVLWLGENKFEHIFFNDSKLENDAFIDEIDKLWEEFHNTGTSSSQLDKKNKLEKAMKKYVKEV